MEAQQAAGRVPAIDRRLPAGARRILARLEQNGFEAFIVGGCVRDSLIGREPGDWDICTSALPNQTVACFCDATVVETGMRHGTVTVLQEDGAYEVTTFRTDGVYLDHRRPEQVRYVSSLREDLSRRDFRINAMAYRPGTGLVDCFGGREDLKRRVICCVGDPDFRFREDALRILRALRFSSELLFRLDQATGEAVRRNRALLRHISAERISGELRRLLAGPGAGAMLREYPDVLEVFLPELTPAMGFPQNSPYHDADVWEHTVRVVEQTPRIVEARLAALFHDIAKPCCQSRDGLGNDHFYGHAARGEELARAALTRLRFETETIRAVEVLVRYHDADFGEGAPAIRRWMNRIGPETFRLLLAIKRADCLAQAPFRREERLALLDAAETTMEEILSRKDCLCLPDLAVTGRDILSLGIPQGPAVGAVLRELLSLVMEERIPNRRGRLLDAAAALLRQREGRG